MGLSSPVMIGVALCCTHREETSASCGAVITGVIYYGGMDLTISARFLYKISIPYSFLKKMCLGISCWFCQLSVDDAPQP